MNIKEEYDDFQEDTAWYPSVNTGNSEEQVYLSLGLVGEAGEYVDVLKKAIRSHGYEACQEGYDKKKGILELGDVFWYFNRLLAIHGLTLDQLRILNAFKLYNRLLERDEWKDRAGFDGEWPFTEVTLEGAAELWEHTFGEPYA